MTDRLREHDAKRTGSESGQGDGALLAVVTVVRNDLDGLRLTHASLRSQTCRAFSWVVVDGASTDGTADYLSRHHGEIFWWCSQPDGGIFDAMNRGLAAVRGKYLLFLNAGDTLPGPDTLAYALARAEEAGWPDLVYADAWERTPDGRALLKRARPPAWIWYGMFTHHQALLYRDAVRRGIGFDTRYGIGADYAFTIAALARARTLLKLDRPLAVCAPPGRSAAFAEIGRHDQWHIRHEMLGIPRWCCTVIAGVQAATWAVRQLAPGPFRRLRYASAGPSPASRERADSRRTGQVVHPPPWVAARARAHTHRGLTSGFG
jgi:putative colanic acid biosynthesis glycosyltransferase